MAIVGGWPRNDRSYEILVLRVDVAERRVAGRKGLFWGKPRKKMLDCDTDATLRCNSRLGASPDRLFAPAGRNRAVRCDDFAARALL
jgi:hypothetical protein